MKKDEPHPANEPIRETRLRLVTWKQEEARLERLRRQRSRTARSIYIPPFPISEDLQNEDLSLQSRWSIHVPPSLKLRH